MKKEWKGIILIILLIIIGLIIIPKPYSYKNYNNCYIDSSKDYRGYCIGINYPFKQISVGPQLYDVNKSCIIKKNGWNCFGISIFEGGIVY